MADITHRRTGELLKKLFDLLLTHPEGMQAGDALATLRNSLQLSPYEAGTYEDGNPRFEKIVRFATIDCVKAGWLVKQKGRWTLTEEGKRAHSKITDPEDFHRRAVKLYHEWKATQPHSTAGAGEDTGAEPAE